MAKVESNQSANNETDKVSEERGGRETRIDGKDRGKKETDRQ